MNAQEVMGYVAIGVGALAAVSGVFLGVYSHFSVRPDGKSPTMPVALLLGAGLLFLFGGGYGLQGLAAASKVIQDLASLVSSDAASAEHQATSGRLLAAAGRGELTPEELELLRAAILENPPEDAEAIVAKSAQGATSNEGKRVLLGMKDELGRRTKEALEAAAPKAEPGKPEPAAVAPETLQKLSPQVLRYLRAAPADKLGKLKIDRSVLRESMRGR